MGNSTTSFPVNPSCCTSPAALRLHCGVRNLERRPLLPLQCAQSRTPTASTIAVISIAGRFILNGVSSLECRLLGQAIDSLPRVGKPKTLPSRIIDRHDTVGKGLGPCDTLREVLLVARQRPLRPERCAQFRAPAAPTSD